MVSQFISNTIKYCFEMKEGAVKVPTSQTSVIPFSVAKKLVKRYWSIWPGWLPVMVAASPKR
jgi:hypothetical protein